MSGVSTGVRRAAGAVVVALACALALLTHTGAARADQPLQATGHGPTQGLPVPGQYLTADRGTWTPADPETWSYQWLRDGVPIAGATGPTYLVQPADVGHALAPHVTGEREGRTAWFTGTAVTARRMTATLDGDVRRVQVSPTRERRVWVAGGTLATERPWPTDGLVLTAYKQKGDHLKALATGPVVRGTAVLRLPWRKAAPSGRTRIVVCFAGSDVVDAACSPVEVVRNKR